jgi:hypothetical protein
MALVTFACLLVSVFMCGPWLLRVWRSVCLSGALSRGGGAFTCVCVVPAPTLHPFHRRLRHPSYGKPANTSEYAWRAQLAQFAQYRSLFEGYAGHMWAWYSAVIMWKSAAPWPSFRGALYDAYLAANGGLWGVRAATGGPGPAGLHLQLNPANATLAVVNRGVATAQGPFGATVAAWDVATGLSVLPGTTQQVRGRGVCVHASA